MSNATMAAASVQEPGIQKQKRENADLPMNQLCDGSLGDGVCAAKNVMLVKVQAAGPGS